MHRLITLKFSHYNEKARWALDRCGVPYQEHGYMPPFCSMAVAIATRGRGGQPDRVSSRFSTPVLITDTGQALCDSTDIARFASRHISEPGEDVLFPTPEVVDLVAHYGDRLGPYTRVAAYWQAFRHPGLLGKMARINVSARQATWFNRVYPLAQRFVKQGLGISQRAYERAMDRVRTEMDEAAERLRTRPHLAGDAFTAADLTLAALLSAAMVTTPQEGYGAVLPALDDLDAEATALVREMRDHPAGQYALRMYREERRKVLQPRTEALHR